VGGARDRSDAADWSPGRMIDSWAEQVRAKREVTDCDRDV